MHSVDNAVVSGWILWSLWISTVAYLTVDCVGVFSPPLRHFGFQGPIPPMNRLQIYNLLYNNILIHLEILDIEIEVKKSAKLNKD